MWERILYENDDQLQRGDSVLIIYFVNLLGSPSNEDIIDSISRPKKLLPYNFFKFYNQPLDEVTER